MFQNETRRRVAVWQALHFRGMEHMTLEIDGEGARARGVVVGVEDASMFRLDYNLACDPDFHIRKARLCVDAASPLHLLSDGQGTWKNWAGVPLTTLMGCVDIDISVTPFTNTLPIRRLAWQVGQSDVFRMAYVSVPTLELSAEWQRYTCVEQRPDGAVFRFESLDSGFTAELSVDRDGLVVDYPGLFKRVSG